MVPGGDVGGGSDSSGDEVIGENGGRGEIARANEIR